jgi:hypothetical protein|tara:strand:+ start:1073 stop:1273 length:201 start_codon:yes stop_codon:yes gene_type:complete
MARHLLLIGEIMAETKTKSKPKKEPMPKWNLSQDDYIELLKSVSINAQAIQSLTNDIKRIKTRMGL